MQLYSKMSAFRGYMCILRKCHRFKTPVACIRQFGNRALCSNNFSVLDRTVIPAHSNLVCFYSNKKTGSGSSVKGLTDEILQSKISEHVETAKDSDSSQRSEKSENKDAKPSRFANWTGKNAWKLGITFLGGYLVLAGSALLIYWGNTKQMLSTDEVVQLIFSGENDDSQESDENTEKILTVEPMIPIALLTDPDKLIESLNQSCIGLNESLGSDEEISTDDHSKDPDYIPGDSESEQEKIFGELVDLRPSTGEISFSDEITNQPQGLPDSINLPQETVNSKRGRKRKRDPASWACARRKLSRAKGEEYITRKGEHKCGKILNFDFDCRFNCAKKIPLDEAKRLWTKHLQLADKELQHAYAHALTTKVPVKQRCKKSGNKIRKETNKPQENENGLRHTYEYRIKREDGSDVKSCQKHFCAIYSTSQKELVRLHKFEGTPPIHKGKGRVPKNHTDENIVHKIESHISSFPPLSSHYSRRENPNRRYLHPNVGSIKNMWMMFLDIHDSEQAEKVRNNHKYEGPYKEWLYRHTFQHNFNLGIGLPRSDTCAECDKFKMMLQAVDDNTDEAGALRKKWDLHVALGDQGYTMRAKDQEDSRKSWEGNEIDLQHLPCTVDACDMYTFDYKKNFLIPNLRHNDIYYQRQLCVYLFGVHDCVRTKSIMYYYPENEARKGGSEVASMVLHAVKTKKSGAKRCIFYTDGCGGQNRNRDTMTFFQKLTDGEHFFEQIDHKILARGHTRLPNDADFAQIEKLETRREVHLPDEYGTLIADSVREKGRFIPTAVTQAMIYDFKQLSKNTKKQILTDTTGQKVRISQYRWFSYGKSPEMFWDAEKGSQLLTVDHPGEVWMKTTLDLAEPWIKVPTAKRQLTSNQDLCLKYNKGKLPLKKGKWNDLQKIKQFLPKGKQQFYEDLLCEGGMSRSIDNESSDSDFDFD